MSIDFLVSAVRESAHRGDDDLLSAGLGLAGLRDAAAAFGNPQFPTPRELRRRAIHSSWNAIADFGPLGRYGELYASVRPVPGREYQAFAKLPNAHAAHRVLAQIPDDFDAGARCLLVTASSGSRGIYGAIALAGAWGLPHGSAVAYTDKGAGSGYFDTADATGVALDGTRAAAGEAELEFLPESYAAGLGIAIKHAHSGDNPEADWGRHVLQAAAFGLAMLERAYPRTAPHTAQNVCIIAVGLSNGGGAVLQAAGMDEDNCLRAVIALEPNVHAPGAGRALYDYATQAALLMPCALGATRALRRHPFRPQPGVCCRLAGARRQFARCWNTAGVKRKCSDERSAGATACRGWSEQSMQTAASTTAMDLWRALGALYACAYTRRPVGAMPGNFRYGAHDISAAARAAWWAEAGGIPPGAGVILDEVGQDHSADPTVRGLFFLRDMWTGQSAEARRHCGLRSRRPSHACRVRSCRSG